jgi:hypothetical protein
LLPKNKGVVNIKKCVVISENCDYLINLWSIKKARNEDVLGRRIQLHAFITSVSASRPSRCVPDFYLVGYRVCLEVAVKRKFAAVIGYRNW